MTDRLGKGALRMFAAEARKEAAEAARAVSGKLAQAARGKVARSGRARLLDRGPAARSPFGVDPVEPAWLEPSVARYAAEDVSSTPPPRICCAPPTAPPPVVRDDDDTEDLEWESPADLLDFVLTPIHARFPELRTARLGSLVADWNGHRELSLVWATTGALAGGFFVADFEWPEGTYFGRPRAAS